MENQDFPDQSDSSDEDYNPNGAVEAVSEVDSDGDSEDPLSDAEDLGERAKKRKKKRSSTSKRKISKESPTESPTATNTSKVESEEDKKKHADSLWSMFKKDTGLQTKKASTESEKTSSQNTLGNPAVKSDKVKVKKIFEFAGEEVVVEKEVSADSAEARLSFANSKPLNKAATAKTSVSKTGGLSSVLGQLGKKQKLSTLEKTKLDWDNFKKAENISDELNAHNKSKDGYLERQDFLERTDVRTFMLERDVRTIERNKRFNNQ